MDNPARVVFARDTRASGSRLVGVLNAALTATEVEFSDLKYLTTPQLHYVVRCKNTLGTQYEYGEPTEQGYYEKLAEAFKKVTKGVKIQGSLTVDCANGVGGPKLKELVKYLPSAAEGGIDIKIVNDNVINPDSLNFEVSIWYGTASDSRTDEIPCSAVPIMSKRSSVLRHHPKLACSIAALLWMAMLIAWYIISSMRATFSDCLMEIALPLSLPLS